MKIIRSTDVQKSNRQTTRTKHLQSHTPAPHSKNTSHLTRYTPPDPTDTPHPSNNAAYHPAAHDNTDPPPSKTHPCSPPPPAPQSRTLGSVRPERGIRRGSARAGRRGRCRARPGRWGRGSG